MAWIITALKWLGILLGLLIFIGLVFYNFAAVFGGRPDDVTLEHMAKMPTYQGGKFENLEPIIIDGSGQGVPDEERLGLQDFILNIFAPAEGKHPSQPLPTLALKDNLPTSDNQFTWLGHSTVLFAMGGKTLITDPVFYRASPIPLGGAPYPMTHLPATTDLPAIDVVLISHDHYDHLDKKAIQEIHERVGTFVVPLGVRAHLVRWGVNPDKIQEFAWHDHAQIDGLNLTYVPSRHYGGRKFNTKNTTLWGGWVVKSADFALYYTGDSGYGKHFSDIGIRYAPPDGFDLVLVENGAYNINWADVHMTPEESVQAAINANAKLALPVHWAKYDLAYHSWREPADRFSSEADKQGLNYLTPQIGQRFEVGDQFDKWWQDVP